MFNHSGWTINLAGRRNECNNVVAFGWAMQDGESRPALRTSAGEYLTSIVEVKAFVSRIEGKRGRHVPVFINAARLWFANEPEALRLARRAIAWASHLQAGTEKEVEEYF